METTPQEEVKEDVLASEYDEIKGIEMEGYEIGVRKARNALFVVAALLLVGEIVSLYQTGIAFGDMPALVWIFICIEVGIFIALAFFTKVKPFICILVGLILFIGLWLYNISENGLKGAFGGILIKIAVVAYLFNSLKDAKALEALRKEI
jgi:hypothetical protein